MICYFALLTKFISVSLSSKLPLGFKGNSLGISGKKSLHGKPKTFSISCENRRCLKNLCHPLFTFLKSATNLILKGVGKEELPTC